MKRLYCDYCKKPMSRVTGKAGSVYSCSNVECARFERMVRLDTMPLLVADDPIESVYPPEEDPPMPAPARSFRLDPSSQAMAVIILDCIATLNQENLTREEYMAKWAKMCTKRLNQQVTVEQLESLANQLGVIE